MNTFVAKLGKHDVLLGRGTGPNEHEGNKEFRILAGNLLKNVDYLSYNKVSKRELAEKLVDLVHSKNGKFVRKLSRDERFTVACNLMNSPSGTAQRKKFRKKQDLSDLYVVVPNNVAIEKAKQSFRHQLTLMSETTASQEKSCSQNDEYDARQHDPEKNENGNCIENTTGASTTVCAASTENEMESFCNKNKVDGATNVGEDDPNNRGPPSQHKKFKDARTHPGSAGPPKKRPFKVSQQSDCAILGYSTSPLSTNEIQTSSDFLMHTGDALQKVGMQSKRQKYESSSSPAGQAEVFKSLNSYSQGQGNPATIRASFLSSALPPLATYNMMLNRGGCGILDTNAWHGTNTTLLPAETHYAQLRQTTDPGTINPAATALVGNDGWYKNPTRAISPTTTITENVAAATASEFSWLHDHRLVSPSVTVLSRPRLLSPGDQSLKGEQVLPPLSLKAVEGHFPQKSIGGLENSWSSSVQQGKSGIRQKDSTSLGKNCSAIETLHTLLLLRKSSF